jgi:hypothetical protein
MLTQLTFWCVLIVTDYVFNIHTQLFEFPFNNKRKRLDEWLTRTQTSGGARLAYTQTRDGRTLGLLKQPTEEDWDWFTCLNSLRDVEPGVNLILQDQGMDSEPPRPTHSNGEAE